MTPAGSNVADLATLVAAELIGGSLVPAEVLDVTHDSRQAASGSMFVAMTGSVVDGHDYVGEAVGRGSSSVCVSRPVETQATQLLVEDTRLAIGPLASAVHGNPSADLRVVGVTGTNGKTTVTHYIESLATAAGVDAGLIGTIETRLAGVSQSSIRTTPEASDFQRLLAEMRDQGIDLVATEVSSHALEYGRVLSTKFAVAAFTNLSQDHLDFHGDMDSYFAAKRRLFEEYDVDTAVVNIDDPAGAAIASDYAGQIVTVGQEGDVRAIDVMPGQDRTAFTLVTPWGSHTTTSPVVSHFNLENLVMAAACSLAAGLGVDDVMGGLATVDRVPGRFEPIEGGEGFTAVVDYAHTPEGVVQAISAARAVSTGRVIAVVGAGGDRDRDKRPLMGEAAAAADVVVITSDNPRTEDPESIVTEVLAGIDPGRPVEALVNRRDAIEFALSAAEPGDIVLVLGRGHEPFQDIGGVKVPFDDRRVVGELLAQTTDSGADSGSMNQ